MTNICNSKFATKIYNQFLMHNYFD